MVSSTLFVIMTIFAIILLLTATLSATIGAAEAYNSVYYTTNSSIRSAFNLLVITLIIGWSSLAVLIVALTVAAVAGGFTKEEVTGYLMAKTDNFTTDDLLKIYKDEQTISGTQATQIIVLVILIIVTIITFIMGVLAATAGIQLGTVVNRDGNSESAYFAAIVAAVAGVGGVILMIVAVLSYVGIRKARAEQLKKLDELQKKAEAETGMTKAEVAQAKVKAEGYQVVALAPAKPEQLVAVPVKPVPPPKPVRVYNQMG